MKIRNVLSKECEVGGVCQKKLCVKTNGLVRGIEVGNEV